MAVVATQTTHYGLQAYEKLKIVFLVTILGPGSGRSRNVCSETFT